MERLAFPGGLDPFDGQGRCIDLRQAAWPVVSRFEVSDFERGEAEVARVECPR